MLAFRIAAPLFNTTEGSLGTRLWKWVRRRRSVAWLLRQRAQSNGEDGGLVLWDSIKDSLLQSWVDLKDNMGALKGMARCCISFLQVIDVYCVPTGVQTCVQACV